MSMLNLGKFASCLGYYKEYCDSTLWTKNELPKFYFANVVNRRINLKIQSPRMIFEICSRIQEKDFYYKPTATRIAGVQFLAETGASEFTESLTLQDAGLIRELADLNWSADDLERSSVSLNTLGSWLGTLMPYRFIPVTSDHFRHTISYLFDLELKIYRDTEYEYFVNSQRAFLLTKKRLKEFSLDSLYLREISEYLKVIYPKSVIKREYEEHDWNWITQDFHLFVYREVLGLDSVAPARMSVTKRAKITPDAGPGFSHPAIANLYV